MIDPSTIAVISIVTSRDMAPSFRSRLDSDGFVFIEYEPEGDESLTILKVAIAVEAFEDTMYALRRLCAEMELKYFHSN